ncbi:kinesin-like protein [Lithohypha guttulata]|uniref:kinesin-like protein n=1 Tax=Lithohypha guttulata TaxID=1690604 RepID=UPI00315C6F5D
MPNSFTTSFASAAAGTSSDNMNRRDGGTDWSRPRVNGTQTFRRPSTQSRDNLQLATSSAAGPYIPPHLNQQANVSRNGAATDVRYTRDEMLGIFKTQHDNGALASDLPRVFAGPWDLSNGILHKPDSEKTGAEICWNSQPTSLPLGLEDMTEEEKQSFTTSVNSPLKLNNPKDGQSSNPGARKTSLSMVNTSGGSRPGVRRRETSDSFAGNGPLSPTENKTFRLDAATNTPPPALLRRRTDLQEESQDKDEPRSVQDNTSPFGTLRRSGTAGPPSAGLNPPLASPWSTSGPQSAFGAMGAFINHGSDHPSGHDPSAQRPAFGSVRSTSRFKDILGKANEDMTPSVKEKASFNGLGKLSEEDDNIQSQSHDQIRNRPARSETNPYGEDAMPARTASTGLSAHDDPGVMQQMGFNPFPSSRDVQSVQTPHHRFNPDPASPTSTNPYQSPQGGRIPDDEGQEGPNLSQPYGRRDVFSGAEHRGQNSFGSLRGLGGGMGGLGGWTNPGFGTGTPGRDRPAVSSAFGDSVFSPLSDLQSPGAFGGNTFFGSGFAGPSRQSKLGLPFPPAMQEQMRSDSRNDAFGGRPDPFEPPRQDSAFRAAFEGMERPGEDAFGQIVPNRSPVGPPGRSSSGGPAEGSGSSSPNGIPTAQQRQMVMPDRMRWVYRDPHGNVQGPWSGLEMHDWFKAGFFTAELQVKKLEDAEYEPLAQLVRRIGNSREPFLVPQIGVPHGPPASGGNPWSAGPTGSAQPPFASAFPSFGTTLTAEQQNALERRKQEEQFLMARQKEYLAQRQIQMNGPPHGPPGAYMPGLVHHSSAHSLHSQPSFGSITSPVGFAQPSPLPAPIGQPPHSANAFRSMTPTQSHDDLQAGFSRLGLDNRGPYSNLNQQSFAAHERNRLSMESQQGQQFAHETTFLGQQGRNERLDEFRELRQDFDEDELEDETLPAPIGSQRDSKEVATLRQPPAPVGGSSTKPADNNEPLSLAQQVQRTAAAQAEVKENSYIESPPVSISPLPAPAAQRSRPQTVAEQLAAESRSTTQTPAETSSASIAPWADKTAEASRGPSLREIQEAEAEQAAKREAIRLAEAKRAFLEQERAAATQVVPPAPGLPATSNWATSGSPGTPTTPGGSVWSAKPIPAKTASASAAKKTMTQILKEEETRKQRQLATQSPTATTPAVPASSGKYAQMVSKVTPPQNVFGSGPGQQQQTQAGGASAWTTVGASGKPKTPATVVAAPAVTRTTSTSTIPLSRPLATSRSTSIAGGTKNQAKEELVKWAKASLSKGLNPGTNLDTLVSSLFELPAEVDLLAEAVYGVTQSLDWRRFAEEFIRRRKLADRGIIEADGSKQAESKSSNNGWSEVAKKGPAPAQQQQKDDGVAGFKVVPSKKKGKR